MLRAKAEQPKLFCPVICIPTTDWLIINWEHFKAEKIHTKSRFSGNVLRDRNPYFPGFTQDSGIAEAKEFGACIPAGGDAFGIEALGVKEAQHA